MVPTVLCTRRPSAPLPTTDRGPAAAVARHVPGGARELTWRRRPQCPIGYGEPDEAADDEQFEQSDAAEEPAAKAPLDLSPPSGAPTTGASPWGHQANFARFLLVSRIVRVL